MKVLPVGAILSIMVAACLHASVTPSGRHPAAQQDPTATGTTRWLPLLIEPYASPTQQVAPQPTATLVSPTAPTVQPPPAASPTPLPAAQTTAFYVAPDGSPTGDGSWERPWDLQTALAQPPAVEPGDTIWLRGGIYQGTFRSTLTGTPQHPITVRQFPGEWATLDGGDSGGVAILDVVGAYTWFWGFTIRSSDPQRISREASSSPADIGRGDGATTGNSPDTGEGVKFINLVIHDASNGISLWEHATDAEIVGCLIYNNGYEGTDRGHGHGIYSQNRTGTKRIRDNIIFNQFSHGIHIYGSDKASLQGFALIGNISFNNGTLSGGGTKTAPGASPAPNILVGGDAPAAAIVLRDNIAFHTLPYNLNVRLGDGVANEDFTATNNYIVGGSPALWVERWKRVTLQNNSIGDGRAPNVTLTDPAPANALWDANRYGLAADGASFTYQATSYDLAGWQAATGLDATSPAASTPPPLVVVRPNPYEQGRAHIVVAYPADTASIAVAVDGVLAPGAQYEVRDAQDYFGALVAEGTYDGSPIVLPLGGRIPAAPIGGSPEQPLVTGPTFQVFILQQRNQ